MSRTENGASRRERNLKSARRFHPHALAEAHGILDLQRHAPPQALHEHAREDVPSAHVRRLAVALAVRARLARAAHLAHGRVLRVEEHGAQQHLHGVRALLETARHVEAALDEHVLRLADLLAVEEHVRERVDAAEHQDGARAACHVHGRRVERLRVEPLVALVGTQLQHVEAHLHRRQDARVHEVELAVARHRRLHGLERHRERHRAHRAGVRLRKVVKPPLAVQANRRCTLQGDRHCRRQTRHQSFFHTLLILSLRVLEELYHIPLPLTR